MTTLENNQAAITRILDYLRSKEDMKKRESQPQIKEKYQNCQNRNLFSFKENDSSCAETEQTNKHYTKIGSTYDNLWKFQDQFKPQLYADIAKYLDITENDVIADLGGGTGEWSQLLKQKNPNCELLLVEPCKSMIERSSSVENISRFVMSHNMFFEKKIYFNKMLVKNCIHHFSNIKQFLDDLKEKLPEGGKAVVLTLTDEVYSFPYPKFVKTYLESIIDKTNKFRDQFYEKDWFSQIVYKNYPATLSVGEIKHLVLGRFTSTLSLFTDEQIKEGIEEQFKDRDDSEIIDFGLNFTILQMEKPYNISLTSEDIQAIQEDLNILELSDISEGIKLQELKQKVENMV